VTRSATIPNSRIFNNDYRIDLPKAIRKKVKSMEIDSMILTLKAYNNLVVQLNAGLYELFKVATHEYFIQNPPRGYSVELTSSCDQSQSEVQQTFKIAVIKVAGKAYTRNCYHYTTSKLLVNGEAVHCL
jgi:hypothetical protein